jgi:hypothetical protein
MGGCCSTKGCDEFFTERVARKDVRRYRKRGLDGVARRMVEFVRRHGVEGRTILEVGGGIGAVQLELLRAGAAYAVNVELSPAYETSAEALLREAGCEGRVERRLLDFAEQSDEVAEADVVLMHRVVCCYPDDEALVSGAAERTRRYLLLSFPRDAWWTRLGLRIVNLVLRLRRNAFRVYLHPPARILGVAQAHGLERSLEHRGLVWQLAAFERPGVASVS